MLLISSFISVKEFTGNEYISSTALISNFLLSLIEFNNKFSINKNSAFSTILIFGYIVDQIKDDLIKIIKKITNIYCEISTWNNKIVIRCLANDNYDLKKTLNYILENIIHDKVPSSWYL